MIGWIIAGCVLFLILLLLFSVAKAEIRSDDTLSLFAGIGIIKFRILPKKEKKPPAVSSFSQKKYLKKLKREEEKAEKRRAEKEKKKEPEKEKDEKKEQEKPKKSFSEKFDEFSNLLSAIVETAGRYSKKLRIRIDDLTISVGASDAADVAWSYGAISQSAAYLLEFLDVKTTLTFKEGAVDVRADFISGKIGFSADVTVGIRLINAVRIGLSILFKKVKNG